MPNITLTDPIPGSVVASGLVATNNANLETVINSGLDPVNLKGNPALGTNDVAVWDGTKFIKPTGTASATNYLRGDAAWVVPGGTEIVSAVLGSTGPTGVSTSTPGDLLLTFSAATFENTKYYWNCTVVNLQSPSGSAVGGIAFQLCESTTVIAVGGLWSTPAVGVGLNTPYTVMIPFTPSAGSHTYAVRWLASNANTWQFSVLYSRLVKA